MKKTKLKKRGSGAGVVVVAKHEIASTSASADEEKMATADDVHVTLDDDKVGSALEKGRQSAEVVDERVARARRDNRAHSHAALHKNSMLPGSG